MGLRTVASGVSHVRQAHSKYGQFLLVPSSGKRVPLRTSLPLFRSPEEADTDGLALEHIHQSAHTVHLPGQTPAATHQALVAKHRDQQEAVTELSDEPDKAEQDPLTVSGIPAPVTMTSLPSRAISVQDEGGYLNWAFSESDETDVFSSKKQWKTCLPSTCNSDSVPGGDCSLQTGGRSELDSSRRLAQHSECSVASGPWTQPRRTFWISSLRRDKPLIKSHSFRFHKEEKLKKSWKNSSKEQMF